MARHRNYGILLTGVWLVLDGLFGLVTIIVPGRSLFLSLLALVAGGLLLAGK